MSRPRLSPRRGPASRKIIPDAALIAGRSPGSTRTSARSRRPEHSSSAARLVRLPARRRQTRPRGRPRSLGGLGLGRSGSTSSATPRPGGVLDGDAPARRHPAPPTRRPRASATASSGLVAVLASSPSWLSPSTPPAAGFRLRFRPPREPRRVRFFGTSASRRRRPASVSIRRARRPRSVTASPIAVGDRDDAHRHSASASSAARPSSGTWIRGARLARGAARGARSRAATAGSSAGGALLEGLRLRSVDGGRLLVGVLPVFRVLACLLACDGRLPPPPSPARAAAGALLRRRWRAVLGLRLVRIVAIVIAAAPRGRGARRSSASASRTVAAAASTAFRRAGARVGFSASPSNVIGSRIGGAADDCVAKARPSSASPTRTFTLRPT